MTTLVHWNPGLAPESGGPELTATKLTNRIVEELGVSIILVTQCRTGGIVVGAGEVSRVGRLIDDRKSIMTQMTPLKANWHYFKVLIRSVQVLNQKPLEPGHLSF